MTITDRPTDQDLDDLTYQLDRAHVFHSWSAQAALHPLVLAGGQGCRVHDHAGRSYLDFSSQLVNLNIGHQHPRVVAAIVAQAQELATVAPQHAVLARGEAAKRITALAPDGLDRVFFTNGGADANENAIRMARLHTGRDKVLSTYRSYHGNTGAAVVATGDWRRVPNEYARGHVHFFGPYLYRSEFWATTPEQESERALQHLRRVIEAEGPSSIAAILLETIPGTAGILMPPPGYLAGVRELASKHGIVLIFDEVITGFRLGLAGAQGRLGIKPDLSVFAKGIGGGFPVAAMGGRREIMALVANGTVSMAGTYSANGIAISAANAALDELATPGIYERLDAVSDELRLGLADVMREAGLPAYVVGLGPLMQVWFAEKEIHNYRDAERNADQKMFQRWWEGMLARGVLFHPGAYENLFVSTAHTPADVAATLAAARQVAAGLAASV